MGQAGRGCPLRQNYTILVKFIRLKNFKKIQFLKIQIFLKISSTASDCSSQKRLRNRFLMCSSCSANQDDHFSQKNIPAQTPQKKCMGGVFWLLVLTIFIIFSVNETCRLWKFHKKQPKGGRKAISCMFAWCDIFSYCQWDKHIWFEYNFA